MQLYLSIMNLGEVFYRVGRVHGAVEADRVLEMLRELPIKVLPAADETVLAAASLKMEHAVSYADAFAVFAALQTQAVLVTGDPELLRLKDVVRLERLERRGS